MNNSDAALLGRVRGRVGVTYADDLPETEMEEELEKCKEALSDEIEERLRKTGNFNFYDEGSARNALEEMMCLKAEKVKAHGQGKGQARSEKARNMPDTVSAIRRTDFEDSTMNLWRDRMVKHLNRVTE